MNIINNIINILKIKNIINSCNEYYKQICTTLKVYNSLNIIKKVITVINVFPIIILTLNYKHCKQYS